MKLSEYIKNQETAGKPAVSSGKRENLYSDAVKGSGTPFRQYAEALKKSQSQSRTPPSLYADAAAQLRQQSGNAARGSTSVLKTIFDKADDRTPTLYSGKYADYMKAGDYSERSKSAGSKRQFFGDEKYDYINDIANFRSQADLAQAQGRGGDYGKYAFMTSDEVGVYNYLYATQGRRAANRFLSDIEPELDKQWYSGANRGTVEVLGKNAGTRALASAMTVAAQPVRNLTSVIAMGEDAVRSLRGQEINPYSKWRQPSNITQELRGDTASHIEETNPGLGGKVGSFVYNTAMSAADSAVNMLVAKGFGEAAGFSGPALMSATNVIGSLAMSSEVASLSIAESKEKGYSNEGALALGLTRGAIEFASEAVGGEWAIKIFKQNPLNLVKSVLLAMAPEGVEEVMSDAANGAVNLVVDALFGTQESGIPKMLEYYKQNGTPFQKEHPELATFAAVLGQEGLSFLGGALASVGSSAVQSYSNKQYVNYVAEQLDTTAQDVVQMMRDAKTDDPGVVYALAELVDAKDADELREKVGTGKDMERAAAYLTQQMETGARSDAKEGTYTAKTQNAPTAVNTAQREGMTIPQSPTATAPFTQGSQNTEGDLNNGQSTYHREERGAAYVGSRGQAAEGAKGGLQALTGGRTEVQRGVGTDAQADLRQVTPAQLGIRNGGTEAVTVVDARKLGGDAARAYNLLAANNIEPVAVRGAIQVNNGYANAYTESGRVFFRVDAVDSRGNAISPEALVRHELFHNYISEEVLQASDEVIRESMTAEEYDAMRDAYKADYAGVYDFANMSVDEIERLLTEEIAADAYAGLNWFYGDAPVQEAVRAETERNAPAQRAEAQQETTGPPEGRTAIEVARSNGDIQRNVLDYADKSARNAAQRTIHNRMVSEGKTLDLTENRESASQYFPDLRAMPKAERTSILREKIRTLKNDLRTYLNQLKGVNFEFEINGNTIEATIYNAGIKEVLQNLTQDKAGMLTASEEIFRNAEYLYSTQDKTGSSTITGWDYFYVPVKMGGDTVGVRIAVRNTVKPREAQIYNWGIKKGDTSLDGVGHLPKGSNSADVSSDASHNSTIRSSTANSQEKSSGRASVEVEDQSEADKRREWFRKMAQQDRQEAARLMRKDETLARANRGYGRPAPDKGAGQVYRELMSSGKSEVAAPISMDQPRTTVYKVKLESDALGVNHTATIQHAGRQIYKESSPLKEVAARNAAEYVDAQANKNFSEENFQRAKKLEAERTAEEDTRIAELFGDSEDTAAAEQEKKRTAARLEAATTDEATAGKITTEVTKAAKSFRENLESISGGAMRMFVNAGDTVRRIAKATGSKSLEGYYFNAGAYSQRAGNWIAKGGARTDIDGHKIGSSLADTLAPMRKNEAKYRDFQLYLYHMHNVDRMMYDNSAEIEQIKENLKWVKDKFPQLRELSKNELRQIVEYDGDSPVVRAEAHEVFLAAHKGEPRRITSVATAAAYVLELEKQRSIAEQQGLKPVFGYEVTAEESRETAKLLEDTNPEFKQWAKEVYKYSDDLLAYRVRAGLITAEYARNLQKRYPHYVPTLREGTNSRAGRKARKNGGITVSNAIGRAVGDDAVLLPLHTALSRKTVSVMRNAGINQLGAALLDEYEGNKKRVEKYIWNVAESEYTPTDAVIESDEDYQPVFQNIFSVKRDGKVYDITMDEGLTQALNAFQPDKYGNLPVAQALKKLNDLFKALCTGYNPFFMVRNFARDWQDAGFYSTDWTTWEKMYPVAIVQIARNGEIWQQYKALGGSYASMLDYTTGMVKEPKSLAGKVWAKYESFGQAIEAAPRLAEFMTILANKGGSKTVNGVKTGKFTQNDLMEAMLGAADITTNFARGGTVTKALNRYLVPFLNPSVQGFDKFVRNATDIVQRRDVKAAATLILKAALINLPPLLLNGLMHGDDDEWDDIPANTKANYYLIKLGNGYWIKIPKGRAIAVLSTAAVYGQEKLNGRDVKFSDVFEVVKSNVAPTDIFNQNIATTLTQAKLLNPDNPGTTWYGGNIESERLQNYRPGDRYDEKTDAISKAVGKFLGISPKKLNYVLDQYSGVIGDILLPYITPATSASHPLLSAPQAAFTIDTTSNNRVTSEYYDLLDDLKYDKNDGDLGAEITRRYVSHAGDAVNDYYAQIREIQNDKTLSKGEKNRLVRALKAQLIERQREIIAKSEPYREAVNKFLKEHPELSSDNDAAIAEFAEKYDITEEQAESRMDAIVYREINREIFGAEYALKTYSSDVYDKARTAYGKGVSYDTYYDYYFATKDMHADKDENGKSISGSKKKKVVEYINSLDIPAEQKDALYIAAGYKENSLRYQPWNGGSGSGRGGRRSGRAKALKAPAAPKAAKNVIPEAKVSTAGTEGNAIADFAKMSGGTDIRKATEKAVDTVIKHGNRTITIKAGSPLDYFLKHGKLPSSR